FLFFLMIPRSLIFTLFPYTTLFRSQFIRDYRITYLLLLKYVFESLFFLTASQVLFNCFLISCVTTMILLISLLFSITFPFFTFQDRKSTRLNSSHSQISYAVFCLKK